MLAFSRSDIVDLIFSTLDHEVRKDHTVESLLALFRRMGIVRYSVAYETWTEIEVRLIFAQLLQAGQLDMRSDGRLLVPASLPDSPVEQFQGAWFVTTGSGRVRGPFTHREKAEDELRIELQSEGR